MAKSSKRRKATASCPSYNTDKFQYKENATMLRDFYDSRNVKPDTFESIPIRPVFDALGRDHVLWFLSQQNLSWIREFYCNIHSIDECGPSFKTWVRLKEFKITEALLRSFLGIPPNANCYYQFLASCNDDFNLIATEIYGTPQNWVSRTLIKQNEIFPCYRLLNIIVCANIHVTTHSSNITQDQGYVLYYIDLRLLIDLARMIVQNMILVFEGKKSWGLPYGCLINHILSSLNVSSSFDDDFSYLIKPIT
ncbi:hypothetical protein ACSBR2_008365 [Camellia fascicularis]